MINSAARRKARHYGMQALYQWQLSDEAPKIVVQQFTSDYDMTHVDTEYFNELVTTIPSIAEELDQLFEPWLQDRSLAELDPITLALLRIAVYEMKSRIDVPYKVVINEAVSLAKKFGAADSFKFINGVLDNASQHLRSLERSE